jgi:hypothetical protein
VFWLRIELAEYVICMQELGLGLMVIYVHSLACKLAQKCDTAGMFNREKKIIEAAFQKLDVSLFSRNPF